jgi:DnaJ-class molecular chaperone
VTREQEVVALLKSWLDYFPWPETWTGELQRRAGNRGPAPFRRVKCAECDGRGKTRAGWMCSTCKGKGSYDVDDYTEEPVTRGRHRSPTCSPGL